MILLSFVKKISITSCRLSLSFAPELSVWLGKYRLSLGLGLLPGREVSVRGSLTCFRHRAEASACVSE